MTNNDGIGNGSIPLRIGRLINTTVYGGPYRKVPVDFWGVKMAAEIDHPHMVSVPTKDFCVPKVSDLKAGIVKALMAMINEENIYVGCMGGIGRTGIFLAALAKVQIEYRKSKHRAGRGEDPVLYVRKYFIPHAVETAEQEKYIADLDVTDIVQWLGMTQTAMGMGGLTPAKEVELHDSVLDELWVKPEVITQRESDGSYKAPYKYRSETDPSHDVVRPSWVPEADKIGDPAFDNFREPWKERYSDTKLNAMYQDTDSADERNDEDAHWLQMESLQSQIDELREDADAAYAYQKRLVDNMNDRFAMVVESFRSLRVLTKQTKYAKICKWLKDRVGSEPYGM